MCIRVYLKLMCYIPTKNILYAVMRVISENELKQLTEIVLELNLQ